MFHSDGHADTLECVPLPASGLGVAEEDHDPVPDELVDRSAAAIGDGSHLAEVVVEDLADVLGFESVGEIGEALDVGEEDGQLLAV